MDGDTIVILGIPVDNLGMDATVERIFSMIDAYAADGVARQVATVNVDFVVNTLAWCLGRVRHPELVDILRRADLVTADGMPIVWVSRLLGNPLRERVAGADMVPRLAAKAAQRGKSIYLLGGRPGVGEEAAGVLKQRYPQLRIAGVDSPFIHVDSESLEWADEEDQPIVERINKVRPDILLIAFGNPKQEVWFDRNRSRLKVPVSIGIGGTFEFIVGTVRRAPKWIQRTGFEWLYRITQDPKRLWKRYFIGFFKFGLLVLPSILYYRYRRLLMGIADRSDPDCGHSTPLLVSTRSSFKVIKFPERFDVAFLDRGGGNQLTAHDQNANMVLDFRRTSFIDSSALGFMVRLWRHRTENRKNLFFLGVGPILENFFKLNRMWDLFQDHLFQDFGAIFASIEKGGPQPSFYYILQVESGFMLLQLFGRLDAARMSELDVNAFLADMGEKNCILDLTNLTFVDSSGLSLFLKLQKHLTHNEKRFVICGLNNNVKQMFRITKLNRLFRMSTDIPSAEKELEQAT